MNSFDISILHEQRLVKIVSIGQMLKEDGEKIIQKARAAAKDFGYNILYDIRESTTNVAFAEWYNLPRKLEIFKDPKARSIKAAVLVSENDEAVNDYKFYENVTQNLGFRVKIFFIEAEALKWLEN